MPKIIGFFEVWILMVVGFLLMLSFARLVTNGFDFQNLIESFKIKINPDKTSRDRFAGDEPIWPLLICVVFAITGIFSAFISLF